VAVAGSILRNGISAAPPVSGALEGHPSGVASFSWSGGGESGCPFGTATSTEPDPVPCHWWPGRPILVAPGQG
jgi:hypothetical protein